jgi:hypothetical protein
MRTMRLTDSTTPTHGSPMPNAAACSGITTWISASPSHANPSTVPEQTMTEVDR